MDKNNAKTIKKDATLALLPKSLSGVGCVGAGPSPSSTNSPIFAAYDITTGINTLA